MAKNHDHHGHGSEHGHHPQHHGRRPVHKDWRLWVGVILMLAAMVVYVLSKDEALGPGQGAGQVAPAAP